MKQNEEEGNGRKERSQVGPDDGTVTYRGAYLDPEAGGTPTLAVCCCPGQGKVIAVGPMIAGIETRNWEPEEEDS